MALEGRSIDSEPINLEVFQLPGQIAYLAAPYTHADRSVRQWRFEMATAAAATLVRRRIVVYSPITMTHPIDVALAGDLTLGSKFWVDFDEAFMNKCAGIIVLQLDGWDQSDGVAHEIEYFSRRGKPVALMPMSEIEATAASRLGNCD
jgi:nucleoside 2-deoxyribosyltransferase